MTEYATERRIDQRVVVLLRAVCHEQVDAVGSQALMSNLSLGGCFIKTQRLLPAGSTINLRFAFPGSHHSLRATGTVRWSSEEGCGEEPGMGVQFTYIKRNDLLRLKNFITGELKRERPDESRAERDRRRSHRFEPDFDLTVRVERGYTFYTGHVRNISGGGIFILTNEPHKVGEKLRVRFKLPAIDKTIETVGIVRWCLSRPTDRIGVPGVGIEFTDLSEQTIADLNEYIADKNVITYEG